MARKTPVQQQGLYGSPQPNFVDYSLSPIVSTRSPTTEDTGYKLGQQWVDKTSSIVYFLAKVSGGVATWGAANGGSSNVNTINSLTPTAGNINIDGTAGEIDVASAGSTITLSTPTAFVAPGSITSTTSITAGNGLTVSSGGLDVTGGFTTDTFTVTGNVTLGSNANDTITLGNTSGSTAIVEQVGTGNYSLDGVGASTYTVGASTTTGTITIGGTAQTGTMTLGSSSGTNDLNIANGAGATALSLANVQTAGSVSIGAGMTSGTISIGGTGAQTGTITLSPSTGAQTVDIANANGAKTINVGSGISGNTIAVGNGANTSAQTVNISAGAAGANSTVNVLSGNATTGTQTLNLATGTGGKTVNIATGAGVNAVTVGSTNTTSATTINAGSGNITCAAEVDVTGGDVVVSRGSAGLDVTVQSTNTDNTNAASRAGVEMAVGGTSAGDPYANFLISGGQTFTMGIDNSTTNDDFVISNNASLGTSNAISIDGSTLDTTVSGNLILGTVATQLQINGGAVTDFIGEATLTAGAVTVANTNIAATDRIFITRRSINGSTALGDFTYAITAATSFTITSVQPATPASTETGDVSIVDYVIIRQN